MSETTDQIDPRNNPESLTADGDASQLGSRSSGEGGPPPSAARPAGSVPGAADPQDGDPESGTQAGNPLDGVTIDPADADSAVPGDEGPEHPGQR